ncbi:MAG: T9SS type A sorting domain-containing protein [Flavobacteriaceae bacterium]|nr:T9SS type A sorting domain-containing protein [Flavobacteriaceae bacterium]
MKKTLLFIAVFFCIITQSNANNSPFINPPSNDECADAIAINCGDVIVGETLTATDSGANAAPDVFYTYTGSGLEEDLTLSLCDGGTDYDSFIRVYEDCTLAVEIISNDDSCGLQSQLTFESDGTSTYYIMIEGFAANSGNFSLELSCIAIDPNEPDNNDCIDAIALLCDETVTGSTEFATDSGGNDAPDVYFSYTGTGIPEVIYLSLCDGGTNYDSWLRVYDDCDLNNELYSNDDSCGLQSEITFVSDGTATYFIMVEGFSANFGDFSLEMTCSEFDPPPNDDCSGAIALNCGETVTGTTASSLSDAGNNSPDVFYSYTGSGTEEWVTISLCDGNTDYNSRLLVYDNCNYDELLSENDNFCGQQSQLTFYSDGVSTYIILVEGAQSNAGNFSLEITCDPILGISDSIFENFSFYPNPSDNSIHVNALQTIENVSIYNMLGQLVVNNKIDSLNSEINISNLSAGNYIMKVSIDGYIGTYKLVKN